MSITDFFDLDGITGNPNEIPIDVLAYIGDSFYNLYASVQSINDGRISIYKAHKQGVKLKCAGGQKKLLMSIQQSLTEEEKDFVRRGMNSKGAKKRGNDEDYRYSTAFEVLVGYLFLTGNIERLKYLLQC